MRHVKANEVLPKELLERIQEYVDGQNLYIPERSDTVPLGQTPYQAELRQRNAAICRDRQRGTPLMALAGKYHLSEKTLPGSCVKTKNEPV